MVTPTSDRNKVELAVLKAYGLRYSVLAAWETSLREMGVMVPASVTKPLEMVRVRLSSGCFPVSEVGADLNRIEANIFSIATTAGQENAEVWLDTLGECMSKTADIDAIEKKIGYSAVKSYFNRFDFSGACGGPA